MRAREFQYTLPCTKIAIQWRFETTDLMHPHCSSGDPHFIYVQSWQYANIVTIANIFKSESKFAKFCHRTRHTRRFQNIKIIARRRTTRIIIRRFLVHEASPDRVSRLFQIFLPVPNLPDSDAPYLLGKVWCRTGSSIKFCRILHCFLTVAEPPFINLPIELVKIPLQNCFSVQNLYHSPGSFTTQLTLSSPRVKYEMVPRACMKLFGLAGMPASSWNFQFTVSSR